MYKYIVNFFIAFSLILTISFNANALEVYEWTLDINTSSKHDRQTYGVNKSYNEDNDGFGVTFGYSEMIDIKVGYFENSYRKNSIYGGFVLNKDFYLFNDIVISPGVGLMLTTGYDDTPVDTGAVTPVVHPTISIGHKTLRSTIGYLPYGTDHVVTFQTQIMF